MRDFGSILPTGVHRESPVLRSLTGIVGDQCHASCGHSTALGLGCLFSASLLRYWFVNGLLDFSTAFALGTAAAPGGLIARLAAYLAVVPVFLLTLWGYHLFDAERRTRLLETGSPSRTPLSLDWFTVGILATGFPIALRALGTWIATVALVLAALFAVPFVLDSSRTRTGTQLTLLLAALLLFVYGTYGDVVTATFEFMPSPRRVLGPIAGVTLSATTITSMLAVTNSLLVGPLFVAAFAVGSNAVLTHPVLRTVPVVRHALPRRDPTKTVAVSSAAGTVFFLLVVWLLTGWLVVVPTP